MMKTSTADRPTRITLVTVHPGESPQAVPLAAAYLAAAVAGQLPTEAEVTVLDLYADQSPLECARSIVETRPDLAGFSVYLWNRALCCRLAVLLRREEPAITLCCGGPEATADQEGLFREAPWDFLVPGEGESVFVAAIESLLAGRGVESVAGTVVMKDGRLQASPAPVPVDLDSLPSPFLSGTIDPSRYAGMLWQITRGCSFSCDFCFDAGGSRMVRRFSLGRIEDELRWLTEHGVSQVFVLDSTFNSDRKRAEVILKMIRRLAPDIHFHFEVRSEFLDAEQARLFASITCSLQIGLQSGDRDVMQRVGRNFTRDDFVGRVNLLNEAGAVFGFDLMYGLPDDSFAGFQKSLDFALGLYPNHLDIFPLALLPGTRLAVRAAGLRLCHLPGPPYTLISSPTFPAGDMAEARRLTAACDIFYSRGKAVSWFMCLLAPLKLSPSAFLLLFADYLDTAGVDADSAENLSEARIFELQCGFVQRVFADRKAKKLLPLALDLIAYNYHYAAALMAVPPQVPDSRRIAKLKTADLRLRLAPSARLARFSYDILELLENESGDLRLMAEMLERSGSRAVIYPNHGEVRTESLHDTYFRFLETIDAGRNVGACAAEAGIAGEDLDGFVKFALREGIVIIA